MGKFFTAIIVMLMFVMLIDFIIINLLLGCNTWDKSLWTEYNSCFNPLDLLQRGDKMKLKESIDVNREWSDAVDTIGTLVESYLSERVRKMGNTREAEEYRQDIRNKWKTILRGY